MNAAHCWKGLAEWIEETYGPQGVFEALEEDIRAIDATCLLPDGHSGDHVFTPDDEFKIAFAPFRSLRGETC